MQEAERPMAQQAEAPASRAPLQAQSSNVQPPAMAQAVQASSKPVQHAARPPIAQPSYQSQVQHCAKQRTPPVYAQLCTSCTATKLQANWLVMATHIISALVFD